MLDRDLTDASDALGTTQYLDGSDPEEDIDAAALKYVIGYEDAGSATVPRTSKYMSVDEIIGEDEFEDVTEIPQGVATDRGRSDSSWRDAVQTEDRKTFKRQRTTERNMRTMSHLWNRLFPIDYDALPIAEYKVIDEVPQLADLGTQADDSDFVDVTMLGGSVASAAAVAGLGLGGAAQGAESVDEALTQAIRSDTSNEDTVMIGNSALSDMLSHLKFHHEVEQGEPEGEPEGDGDIEDAVVEETPEDVELPAELTTLYDDAMGMLSSVDEERDDGYEDGFDEAEADLISQMDLDDVSIPADGDIVATDATSSDYRGGSEPQDIYESDEWKAIEDEIEQSKEAVKTGLERLDALAGIAGLGESGEEGAGEATDEATDEVEEPADATTDTKDKDTQEASDDSETVAVEAETEDEPVIVAEDEDETTDEVTEDEPVATQDGNAEDTVAESASEPELSRPSFLSRIVGMFKRDDKQGKKPVSDKADAVSDTAAEEIVEATEPEPVVVTAEPEGADEIPTAVSEPEQESEPQGVTENLTDLAGTTDDEADEMLTQDLTEATAEQESWESTATDEGTQWESVDTGNDIITIGEDYRENYRDKAGQPSKGDDDIIPMRDDTDSHDYRNEVPQTERPTEPMSDADIQAPAEVAPRPSAVIDPSVRMQSMTQRIAVANRKSSVRGVSKARRQKLEVNASPELMLPLPLAKDGQIDANIRVKTTEFLSTKRLGIGARSSHVKLSVKPSKARLDAVTVLPEGTGYVPEKSPVGRGLREQGHHEYEPVRRIGETLDKKASKKVDRKTLEKK